jgi:hypothetical protein
MTAAWRAVVLPWLLLVLLVGGEAAVTLLLPGRFTPMLVLLGAAAMLIVVGLAFMRLRRAPSLGQGFVIAALFWIAVLLGLGSMDPLTRVDVPVPVTRFP